MRALTIKQPWASLIMSGFKLVENRTWRPPKNLIGKRFVIHAGKRYDRTADGLIEKLGLRVPENVPHGFLLGTVVLDSVVETSDSPWFSGPFGWILRDPIPFTSPVLARGKLGLWIINLDKCTE